MSTRNMSTNFEDRFHDVTDETRNGEECTMASNLIELDSGREILIKRGLVVNSKNNYKEENQDSDVIIASQHIVSEIEIVISHTTGAVCVNEPPSNEAIPEEHNSFGNSQRRGHIEHPVSPQAGSSEGNVEQETHPIVKSNGVKLVPESEVQFAGDESLHENFGIGSQFIDSKMAVTSSPKDNHKLATNVSFGEDASTISEGDTQEACEINEIQPNPETEEDISSEQPVSQREHKTSDNTSDVPSNPEPEDISSGQPLSQSDHDTTDDATDVPSDPEPEDISSKERVSQKDHKATHDTKDVQSDPDRRYLKWTASVQKGPRHLRWYEWRPIRSRSRRYLKWTARVQQGPQHYRWYEWRLIRSRSRRYLKWTATFSMAPRLTRL